MGQAKQLEKACLSFIKNHMEDSCGLPQGCMSMSSRIGDWRDRPSSIYIDSGTPFYYQVLIMLTMVKFAGSS